MVILWFLIIELLALAAYPLSRKIFFLFSDKGWGFCKIIGILTLAFGSWAISATHISSFNKPLVATLFLLFLIVSGYVLFKKRREILEEIKENWKVYLVSEVVFLVFFIFFLTIRLFSPDIFGAEKFMDFAFLNSLSRFDAFPPADPWLSSGTINYYYFGYFTWATLAKLINFAPSVIYNLAVVTIGALVAQGVFSISYQLTKKISWGVAGTILAVLIGNLAGSTQIFGRGLAIFPYNYWEPTRVISGTINEFPFFSFIWADLHPHLMAMPNFVLFIALAYVLSVKKTWPLIVLMGVSFGLAYATSGWDAPSLATLALLVLLIFSEKGQFVARVKSTIKTLAWILGIGILTALPFIASYSFPKMNIGLASVRSDLPSFILVFGLFLFVILAGFSLKALNILEKIKKHKVDVIAITVGMILFMGVITQSLVVPLLLLLMILGIATFASLEEEQKFPFLLGLIGLLICLGAELIFIDDTYGPANQRLNSVFKFHLHAWYFFAIASASLLPFILSTLKAKKVVNICFAAIFAVLFVLSLIYPIGASYERANGFKSQPRLDGIEYLKDQAPDEYEALKYLLDNVDDRDAVIVEATGNPYGTLSRVSAYTGLKTILGWANHERLWRRDDKSSREIEIRAQDIKRIYEEKDLEKTKALLSKYRVSYIYIGNQEKSEYN